MVRLQGIILPDEKRIDYALTLFYGIGWTASKYVLTQAGVQPGTKVSDVKEDEFKKILSIIEKNYAVEGDLREKINSNIKRLREINSYRGGRHTKGLPVHGQRTRSNARTKRGKRKTVGALKKEAWAKMEQTQSKPAAGAATK